MFKDFDILAVAERWWKLMGQDIPGVEVVDELINQMTLVSLQNASDLRAWYNL